MAEIWDGRIIGVRQKRFLIGLRLEKNIIDTLKSEASQKNTNLSEVIREKIKKSFDTDGDYR